MLDVYNPDKLRAVLEAVAALEGTPLVGKMQFLLGHNSSLGGLKPLEALERGQLD
jgi:hypothetical protein